MAPPSKPAATRQRRNKTSTHATLTVDHDVVAPELPDLPGVQWHPYVAEWWADVWRSPMAPEWDQRSDAHGLVLLAILRNDFWLADTAKQRREAAAEIRLQDARFGLSPLDRRRLQWAIETGDAAAEKTQRRRWQQAKQADDAGAADPRSVLHAAS